MRTGAGIFVANPLLYNASKAKFFTSTDLESRYVTPFCTIAHVMGYKGRAEA